jgi:hypothetical protein
MAMGHYCWLDGWFHSHPQTICGPEDTGDASAILLKHGLGVHNFEFQVSDSAAWFPTVARFTMGMSLEPPNFVDAINSEGEHYQTDFWAQSESPFCSVNVSMLNLGEYYHGRGSEFGGAFLDVSNNDGLERFYRRTRGQWKRFFDYEMPDVLEVTPEFWSS